MTRAHRHRLLRGSAMFAFAMLAGGCEHSDRSQSVLHPSGIDAFIISDMAWLLFGGGAVIFIGVMALLAFSLRQRQRVVSPADLGDRCRCDVSGRSVVRIADLQRDAQPAIDAADVAETRW
jgi:hypothetical protein